MTTDRSDSHCYVLRAGTPASVVTDLAAERGWVLVSDEPPSFNRAAIKRWRPSEEADADQVELISDHMSGCHTLTAPEPVRWIAEALPVWTAGELLDQARSDEDPLVRMRALRALQYFQIAAALRSAPDSPLDPDEPHLRLIADDERYLDVFRQGLDDPVPGVRRAAVDGLCRTFYPGAQPILRAYRDRLAEQGEPSDQLETIDWYLEKGLHRIRAKSGDDDA
ncbi:HEAT repeat domain-containing protein [Hamadaea sp. NPDC051192]|uniref:HEAT repeat domain-containing protein n=1 Tax=Hamadaea sp. NPDC051192 TaxID=3154940 RepID=UPI00341280E5